MKVIIFSHPLLSDGHNGHAGLMPGIASELRSRGHNVVVYEPRHNSLLEVLAAGSLASVFRPGRRGVSTQSYSVKSLDVNRILSGADLVLVHAWSEPEVINLIGEHHVYSRSYKSFLIDPRQRPRCGQRQANPDCRRYDGVLAGGDALRDWYLSTGAARRAWTWHPAVNTSFFRPLPDVESKWDVTWIGDWRDGPRSAQFHEFLARPVRELGLRARVYGARYPESVVRRLASSSVTYGGWLPEYRVPEAMAAARVVLHLPSQTQWPSATGLPCTQLLFGLACGRPVVSAPWQDEEGMFFAGEDYLMAGDSDQMRGLLRTVLGNPEVASRLAGNGL